MSALNPSTSNFTISFSGKFYNESIDQKYNDYLLHANSPIKDIGGLILESIQSVSIAGFDYQEITIPNMGGSNGFNETMPGTANQSEILDSQNFTITYRNNLINWMRMNEFAEGYYDRKRTTDVFDTTITFMNSANLPMMMFYYSDCYISGIPGLTFSNNEEFNDAKTFDTKISFKKREVKFAIPKFKKTNVTLKTK